MKYKVIMSNRFSKDLKAISKRGYDLDKIKYVIKELSNGNSLPDKYKDHMLKGDYASKRECHIEPDWLLIYEIDGEKLILILLRTGTHSDLFNWFLLFVW